MNNQNYIPEKRNNPDLLDLLIILLKYKWVVISCLLLTYIITFSFFYLSNKKVSVPIDPSKEIYYSECVIYLDDLADKLKAKIIISNGDLADKLKAKLISRGTLLAAGQFFNLSAIRQTSRDEKNNKWITEQIYYRDEQTKKWTSTQPAAIQDMEAVATLSVKSQNRLITLRFSHTNPEVPQKALNFFLDYVSEFFRKPMLEYYKAQKDIYQKQIANAQDPVLKGRLFEQYSNLIDRDSIAKNEKFYGMEMIDSPSMVENNSMSAVSTSASPGKLKYGVIIALVTLVSIVISISLIFFIEYIAKMRKNDPERFNLINKYRRFR